METGDKSSNAQPNVGSSTEFNRGLSSSPNMPQATVIRGNVSSRPREPISPSRPDATAFQSLPELYREWVQSYSNRSKQYETRLDAAWNTLLADIRHWQAARAKNPMVRHHIKQFEKFVTRAFDALINDHERNDASNPAEVLDFRALVIGVFTTQWSLLRNVAQQRIAGSPYRDGVIQLDEIVKQNYARLYTVVNPKLKVDKQNRHLPSSPLLTFAPLVYLGNAGELTVFNRRVPLMLSVPLAALPGTPGAELAQMAIPHETAHALFSQIPELLEEIGSKLDDALHNGVIRSPLTGKALTARETLIYRMTFEWIEEICADLFGTALAGEAFARSARWAMLSSEDTAGITDKTHPPTIIRPLVHLLALSTMESENKRFEETRKQFQDEIDQASAQGSGELSLNRRFRSVPALIFVRLATVSTILSDVVTRILPMQLATLNGAALSSVLREIYALKEATLPADAPLPAWGEDPTITSESFVLDFPAELFPSYTTPGVTVRPDGWDIPIVRDILSLLGKK